MRISTSSTITPPALGPAERVSREFSADFRSLQGARFTYLRRDEPLTLHIAFETPDLRALADNVLRDGVQGATLVLTSPPGEPSQPSEPGAKPWYDSVSAMARSIDAMPGVVGHNWAGHLGESIVFRTTTPEVAKHLSMLVSPKLGFSTVYFLPAG